MLLLDVLDEMSLEPHVHILEHVQNLRSGSAFSIQGSGLEGYLAHKKLPPSLGPP